MGEGAAVTARGLAVGHHAVAVVDGIEVDVAPGQLLCLMGTNGCGKSTLLKTLAGLLAPVGGAVAVLGRTPPAPPERVAYLSQHPGASTTLPLRVGDVVAMGRYAHLGLFRRASAADRAACDEAMERLDIGRLRDRPLLELSGGQRQRAHLAQAVARRADLLLVDEPTAGLDPASRERWTAVVRSELERGAAVVMATHDLADAEGADTVMLLAHRVIAVGPPATALTDANLRACYGFTERH